MPTYEIKRPRGEWISAGEELTDAEAAMRAQRDRSQPSTVVWLRNNFNGSVTVFEVDGLGHVGNRGPYGAFYSTDTLPA